MSFATFVFWFLVGSAVAIVLWIFAGLRRLRPEDDDIEDWQAPPLPRTPEDILRERR